MDDAVGTEPSQPFTHHERFEEKSALSDGIVGKRYICLDTLSDQDVILEELPDVLLFNSEHLTTLSELGKQSSFLTSDAIINTIDIIQHKGRFVLITKVPSGYQLSATELKPLSRQRLQRSIASLLQGLQDLHDHFIYLGGLTPESLYIGDDGSLCIGNIVLLATLRTCKIPPPPEYVPALTVGDPEQGDIDSASAILGNLIGASALNEADKSQLLEIVNTAQLHNAFADLGEYKNTLIQVLDGTFQSIAVKVPDTEYPEVPVEAQAEQPGESTREDGDIPQALPQQEAPSLEASPIPAVVEDLNSSQEEIASHVQPEWYVAPHDILPSPPATSIPEATPLPPITSSPVIAPQTSLEQNEEPLSTNFPTPLPPELAIAAFHVATPSTDNTSPTENVTSNTVNELQPVHSEEQSLVKHDAHNNVLPSFDSPTGKELPPPEVNPNSVQYNFQPETELHSTVPMQDPGTQVPLSPTDLHKPVAASPEGDALHNSDDPTLERQEVTEPSNQDAVPTGRDVQPLQGVGVQETQFISDIHNAVSVDIQQKDTLSAPDDSTEIPPSQPVVQAIAQSSQPPVIPSPTQVPLEAGVSEHVIPAAQKTKQSQKKEKLPTEKKSHRLRTTLITVLVLIILGIGGTYGWFYVANPLLNSGPLKITGTIALHVSPRTSGCQATFSAVATGMTSGKGTLKYEWVDSDGTGTAQMFASPVLSLTIPARDRSFSISHAWNVNAFTAFNGSVEFRTLSPSVQTVLIPISDNCPPAKGTTS